LNSTRAVPPNRQATQIDIVQPTPMPFMKTSMLSALLASLAFSTPLPAQVVPTQLSYQGHIAVNGSDFRHRSHIVGDCVCGWQFNMRG
jgi:hypothetical protein